MKAAVKLYFKEDTILRVLFEDGVTKEFDMSLIFNRRPELHVLSDGELFNKGKLSSSYGISWNDDLDIAVEYIYENGKTVKSETNYYQYIVGYKVKEARNSIGMTQKELSKLTGIAQGDISKLEKGIYNPSINHLLKISSALHKKLMINFQ